MSCYTINLKQLRNCGLSLNDKMRFEEKIRCIMGGPVDIVRVRVVKQNQNGISMWSMLDSICYNYSTENAWDRMSYLSGGRYFEDFKTPLLTNSYYKVIEPKIIELQNKERIVEVE